MMRPMMRGVVFCLTVLVCGQAVVAKDPPTAAAGQSARAPVDELSSLLSASREKYKLPAMAAGIVEGNRVAAIAAVGVRCRGHVERITVDDLFHIGSDTKSMTATVAAMLVEEGKLQWTSSPVDVLSKYGISTIDPAWKKVTLEELLAHRAGVQANPDPLALLFVRGFAESPQQERRDVCRAILGKPPAHPPGKDFLYSNTGLIIAGTMEEAVAGEPWEDLMRHRLFEPLGMTSAGFGPPGMPPPKTGKLKSGAPSPSSVDEPCGHAGNGSAQPPSWDADNPACYGPAGTVHVSLRDWAKYASFHLTGERGIPFIPAGASKPLLSVESIRRLHTPLGGAMDKSGARYAMGWGVLKERKSREPVFMHFGSNGFWLAGIALYPARNFAVLVATNQGGAQAQQACSQLLRSVAEPGSHP
jgi:CubicO group peptidase (beta-lactamase class C family)